MSQEITGNTYIIFYYPNKSIAFILHIFFPNSRGRLRGPIFLTIILYLLFCFCRINIFILYIIFFHVHFFLLCFILFINFDPL